VEIDEVAARMVRQYWALIVLCVLVPLTAIALTVAKQPPMYAAAARIVTGSTVPASNAQADAIVSQVQGIATGRTAAAHALSTAGVSRNLNNFITSDVTVAGLGGSQVVDLTVTDRNPQVAATVAKKLAAEVIGSINNVGQSGLSSALKAIDSEIVRLSEQRSVLATAITAHPRDQTLQAKLAGLDEVVANFTGDRSRLLIQASSQGLATVIDQPVRPIKPESKALAQKLGLAGLLGLVGGILIASIAEVIRPTVPGARRVGRRLGSPTLGRLTSEELRGEATPGLENLALRLRLAAIHADLNTIALVDVNGQRDLTGLASSMERALQEVTAPALAGRGAVAADNNHHQNSSRGTVAGGVGTSILIRSPSAAGHQALHVYPLGQMKQPAGMGRVGIVVLSGPVARVSRITALDDLVTSSGWPIVAVVGVPRLPRKWFGRRRRPDSPVRQPASTTPANGARPEHDAEGRGQ
jgi:capsular polysaccharide biosynthesis protein